MIKYNCHSWKTFNPVSSNQSTILSSWKDYFTSSVITVEHPNLRNQHKDCCRFVQITNISSVSWLDSDGTDSKPLFQESIQNLMEKNPVANTSVISLIFVNKNRNEAQIIFISASILPFEQASKHRLLNNLQ